ncbi:uncharacterized protein LOC125768326 isoform X1 [Anopheles funestus]|uniref:uncharacterized protein LOC125768326 isoform X1 n=1 Tax=Anopheles funestus TaxID=62324 RepID=UPI0020C6B27E|nr:uncharacterized protein LOC125768326 isoform X1 [Anopheles funestus]
MMSCMLYNKFTHFRSIINVLYRSNMNSTVEQKDDRVTTTSTNMSTVYNLVEYMLKNSTKGLPRVGGDLYHLRLAIMIILRKYKMSQLDNEFNFAVALEVTAAGKFDDIVLFYSSPRQVTGTWYIQAKYKQNMGSKIEEQGLCAACDSEFSIPMYFVSFLEIDQNLPKDARYILCSTAGLHEKMEQYFKVIIKQQDDSLQCNAVNTQQSDLKEFCKDIEATCYQLDWDKPFPALLEAVKDSCLSALGRKLALFVCSGEVITLNDTFFSTFLNLIYKCIAPSELETSDPSVSIYKLTKGFSDEANITSPITPNRNLNKETTGVDKPTPIEKIQTAFKTERKKLLERKFKKHKTNELNIKFDKASFKSAQDTQDHEEFAKFDQRLCEFYSKFLLMSNSCNEEKLREKAIALLPSWCVERETVFDKLQGKVLDAMKPERRVPMDLAFWQKIFVNVNLKQNITDVIWYSKEYLKSVREKHPHIEVNPERLKEFKLYEVLKESGPGIYEFNSTLELTVYSRIIFQALSQLKYETIFVDSAKYTKQQDMNDVLKDLLSYLRDVNHPTIKVITILGKPEYVAINELKELSDKYRQKIVVVEHISGSPQDGEISERIYVKDLSNEALQQLYLQNERMMFGTTTPLIGIVEENDDLSFLLNVLESCEPNEELIYQHLNKNNYEKIKYWYVHRHYMPYKEDNKLNENDLEFHSALEVKRVLATSNEEPDLPGFQDGDSGKVFIFLNDAGFGKTTYFTWLAWRLSRYDQSLYVIKFIALKFSTDFQRLSNVENLDETEIVRLLYRYIHLALFVSSINKHTIKETDGFREEADRCANLLTVSDGEIVLDETKTKRLSTIELFELRLFKEKFNKRKLVLILDGFDEIAPYFKDVVMKCFGRFSRLDGVRLLYLSSRPYGFEQELKNTFPQCQIYRLKPFSRINIITSLHKFLVNNLDGYERYKEIHRNSILMMLSRIIKHVLKDIIRIPLLLYMVLVILLPEIKSCVNENTHNISQQMLNNNQIDILYLVEEFVDRKFKIANTDKIGTTDFAASTAAAITKEVRLKKEIMKQHMLLAMYVIFDAKDREKLLSKVEQKSAKKIMKKVNQGAEKTGIVLGVQGGVPQFLHRIFAEYFSACWLFENWKRFKNESIFHSQMILSRYLSKTREFLDRLILRGSNGCDLHLALVNGSYSQVEEILRNNPTTVTVKDRVGRLPLHLVEYINPWPDNIKPVILLLKSISRKMSPELIHVNDELFGWNAIDYAFFHNDSDLIEMLFKSGLEPNMDNLIQQVRSNDFYTLLWMACKYTNYLVDCMDQKDLADELSERVAKYLVEENKIDIYAPLAQLHSSSVLDIVITVGSIFMFRQLIEKSGPQKLGLGGRAKRLFLISLKKERYDFTNYLIERNPSFVSMIKNNQCLYLCAKKAIESNQKKLFKTIFIQVCSYNRIKCVKKDIIIDRFDDRMENETINFEIPFEQYCCSKDFYYCEDAVVTNIFSAAIHYGNIPMIRYILQKTNMDVTVEMIGNVMEWIRNNYFGNHKNNVPVYRYILKKVYDHYGDDQEGLNLFLMTIKHGCVYMLPSLVAIGFNPKKICMRNHWDIFQYRLDMSTEMCSANVFVYLQQRSYLDCFDAFGPEDESIFEFAIKESLFTVAQALIEDKFRNESEKEKAIRELLNLQLHKYGEELICDFIKNSLDESSIGGKMENDTWHSVYYSIRGKLPKIHNMVKEFDINQTIKKEHVISFIKKSVPLGTQSSVYGELYNRYLAISIILRQFKKKNQFIVGTEVPEAGQFDDILYHHQSPNGTSILWIQAKHVDGMFIKVKDLCAANGMYSVPTYFSSFLEIVPELTKGESESHKDEHKTQYAICTNAELDENVKLYATKIEPQEDDALQFCDDIRATCYQLRRNIPDLTECLKKSCKNVFKNDSDFDEKKDQFFSKFLLICNSYNHKQLRIKVRNLLPEWCDEAQRELVIDNLVGLLNNIVYNKPRYYITLERIQKWFLDKDFNQNISVLKRLSEEHLKSVLEKHIEVNPERLKEFKLYEVLKESGPGIYEFNSTLELTVYSRILFQALSLLKYETIFVKSEKYTKQQDMNDVLEDLLSYLRDVNHPTIKIITILGKPDYVAINELKELSDKYRQKIVVVEHISGSPQNDEISERIHVKDLSNEALQQLYLQNERMMFGTTTPLIGIVEENDDLSLLLVALDLCDQLKWIKEYNLNEHNYEKIKHWYVHRYVVPFELEEKKDNFIGSYDISVYDVPSVLISTEELCYPPGVQDDKSRKVFIFLNDAGHGKTAYFTWLAWRLASYDQSLYVIKFIAMEFSTDFQRLSNVENLDETEIVRLLYRYIHLALFVSSINKHTIKETDGFREEADRCANLLTVSDGEIVLDETKTKRLSTIELFELRLFKEKFNEHKLVLILDGFDEIAPYSKDVVMKCFGRFSRLDGVRLLYLSSRPYGFEEDLRKTFADCQMYRIQQFSNKNIKTALYKFLVSNLDGYEYYEEEHRIDILRCLYYNCLCQLKDIITISQLLSMVLDFLLPVIKKCVNENTHNLSRQMLNNHQIDILYLVEEFVDRKMKILNTNKIGTTDFAASTAAAITKEVRLKKEIMKQHMLLAMYVIFDAKERETLLSKGEMKRAKNIIKKVNKGEEKTGIVLGIQGGVPQFLHRIFAEYFSACWLFENWKRFKNESIFHSKAIWSDSLRKTREFLDRLILKESKGCDLHMALVNGSNEQIEEILRNNPSAVIVKDRVGRLPLHLVEYTDNFTDAIIDKMSHEDCDHNLSDHLYGWNALDYAFVLNKAKLIKILLKKGIKVNMDRLFQHVCSNNISKLLILEDEYVRMFDECLNRTDLADELSERVARYLIEENEIDIYSPSEELNALSVLQKVVTIGNVSLFHQLLKNPEDRARAIQMLELSVTKGTHKITNYLLEHHSSFIETTENSKLLYHYAIKAIKCNDYNSFTKIFDKFVKRGEKRIVCEDESEPIKCQIPFEDKCCDGNDYDFEHFDGQEFCEEKLLSLALHFGNVQMTSYIIQQTNTNITVRFVSKLVLEITRYKNHKTCTRAFNYLFNNTFDLYGLDYEGLNLFLMIIKHGCVYMLPSLVAIGFNPKKICMSNHWDIFQYRLLNSTEMCSANVFVYLQQRSYLDCFDAFGPEDESIFEFAIKQSLFIVAQALIEDKFRNASEKEKAIMELLHLQLHKYGKEVICDFIKNSLDESSIGGKMENVIWNSVYSSIFNNFPRV